MADQYIKELTEEQLARCAEFTNKWNAIGLCTDPCDRAKAERIVDDVYKAGDLAPPTHKVWINSPDEIHQIAKEGAFNVSVSNYCFGNHDANWLGFYNYFEEVCQMDCVKPLRPLMELAENCGWWYPLDELCVLCERPKSIYMKNDKLHCDGGPAIEYRNSNFCVYSLNGVRVSKELACTPAGQLDPTMFMAEKNVEIRREIIRKIGIERIIDKCGATVLDKDIITYNNETCEYELLEFQVTNERTNPYLKMQNPSIGIYCIEAVHPQCTTVREALACRNNSDTLPDVIS